VIKRKSILPKFYKIIEIVEFRSGMFEAEIVHVKHDKLRYVGHGVSHEDAVKAAVWFMEMDKKRKS
jgi:hypothetical protein